MVSFISSSVPALVIKYSKHLLFFFFIIYLNRNRQTMIIGITIKVEITIIIIIINDDDDDNNYKLTTIVCHNQIDKHILKYQ